MVNPIEQLRIIPLRNSLVVSDLLSFILITPPIKSQEDCFNNRLTFYAVPQCNEEQ